MSDEPAPTTYDVRIPPPLVQMPTCPLCNSACDTGGAALTCESCNVYWPDGPDAHGQRADEEDVPACGVEREPFKGYAHIDLYRYRCVLDAGHEDDHRGVRCDRRDDDGVFVWPRAEAFDHDCAVLENDEPCPRRARGETCTDCPPPRPTITTPAQTPAQRSP